MSGSKPDAGVPTKDAGVAALQHWAAFVMTLGPGAAMGFYVATVGFYVANFESRVFFIAMAFCAYLPGPLVAFLQQLLDDKFDERYSPTVTYFFRVVLLQLVLAVAALVWILMPQTPASVLVAGLVIGTLSWTVIISSTQMVVAMDPVDTGYAMLGNLVGGAMPVAAFLFFSFSPESSLASFRLVLMTLPVICVASSVILGFMHVHLDLFQKTFDRLGYDMIPRETEELGLGPQPPRPDRQLTETQPLAPVADGKVPSWVWAWCTYTAVSTAMSVSVVCLVAFIGKPDNAQMLAVSKLSMDLVGGVLSLMLPGLTCFELGPWHKTLACTGVLRLLLLFVILGVLAGWWCPYKFKPMVMSIWLSFHLLQAISIPHIGVTIGFYVLVKDRKRVLRMNTACRFAGGLVGVIMAAAVVVPLLGLGAHWPSNMHQAVPADGVGTAGARSTM